MNISADRYFGSRPTLINKDPLIKHNDAALRLAKAEIISAWDRLMAADFTAAHNAYTVLCWAYCKIIFTTRLAEEQKYKGTNFEISTVQSSETKVQPHTSPAPSVQ
jgi:hypothetical protein